MSRLAQRLDAGVGITTGIRFARPLESCVCLCVGFVLGILDRAGRGLMMKLRAYGFNIDAIKDGSGNILGAVNCFQDVTERKRSERQITTLAGEAEHRTKNILAIVQAAVGLSQSDSADGVKQAIEGRIKALAKVYSLFIQSRWEGSRFIQHRGRIIREQSKGEIRLDWNPAGLQCAIILPIPGDLNGSPK